MAETEGKEKSRGNIETDNFKIEERKLLFNAMLEGAKFYDKAILTISAGAYGLSLSVINNFQPIDINTLCYIKYAWYSFAACIVLTLVASFTSYQACNKNLDILENNKKNDNDNNWSKINNAINIVTFIIFVIGFICLTQFGIINISKKEGINMSKETSKQPGKVQTDSFTPPKVPKPTTPKPQEPPKGPSPKK